ncbi:hypothetical protein MTZ49_05015 [Entomomonas sp. E2T0]|uniref:hypothetical protein n=1 Tax=Entomomonas sp. E2T0 TaxID=2930213 RepID=UPI0022281337|nr:hypothetical protein [Entomomonas sp. E2T0]UYZ84927.1 hypothetical protein MTZ49_05015 [Entomomonas sp. E2T0]
MTKKLIILLFSLFIPFAYADVTPSISQKAQTLISGKQEKGQNRKTDLTKELLNPVDLPITRGQLQGNNQWDFGLPNKEILKGEDSIGGVLPDLFNMPTGQDRFGIRGDVIKSVDLKEKGDIDGANIQFIFRK